MSKTIKGNWRNKVKSMKRSKLIPCAVVLFVIGCAGGGGVSNTGPRKQRNLITQGEIATLDVRSIGIAVYVNGIRMMSGMQSLYDISPTSIHEIRYLSSFDATARFGTDVPDGAISITTK